MASKAVFLGISWGRPRIKLCRWTTDQPVDFPVFWIEVTAGSRTFGVPVQVRDVAGITFADTSPFTAPHTVDIHKVIMWTHGQELTICGAKIGKETISGWW